MFQPEKENLETQLQKLREESKEYFYEAKKEFNEKYSDMFTLIFDSHNQSFIDTIQGYYEVLYVDNIHKNTQESNDIIFQKALQKTIEKQSLSPAKKQKIIELTQALIKKSETLSLIPNKSTLKKHIYHPLIEDMMQAWDMAEEEYRVLQRAYEKSHDIYTACALLPEKTKNILLSEIHTYKNYDTSLQQSIFQQEYHQELAQLEQAWLMRQEVIFFIARSYYQHPGKYKKRETPFLRMKRTFKFAVLRLIRQKLWNIDADILLEKFENLDTFYDLYLLIYRLFETLDENPQSAELYQCIESQEELNTLLDKSQTNEEKILAGQKCSTRIGNLIGETDGELESGLLDALLDDATRCIWEELHFEETHAWVLAQGEEKQKNTQKKDEDELEEVYNHLTPRGAYEQIKIDYANIEEEKRKAFLEGNYDLIDIYNERLFSLQKKLEKLVKLLKIDES